MKENMNGLKGYGLVLTGGGGKGSFQIGAWQALAEHGIDREITAVSGASVGILNAAMFVQGQLEMAKKVWLGINTLDFLEPMIRTSQGEYVLKTTSELIDEVAGKYEQVRQNGMYQLYSRHRYGFFTRDGLVNLIEKNVDLDKVSQSDISLYTNMCKCEDDETLSLRYEKLNGKSNDEMIKYMLASSALPFIYDAVKLEDGYYLDGGIMDNVPVKPLYDAGYRNIIVIGLKPDYGIDYSKFKDCEFTFIMPCQSLGNFMNGTLDFSKDGAKFRISLGYRNASRVISAMESGMINSPGYKDWLVQMAPYDVEAAKGDVRKLELEENMGDHMDKLKSIYDKYLK